ncbi:MAG: aspartyl protease family protein [Chloracidobacterium sp.]|nr:aspartyl protease family protein [Chloracidobacterium sp.]
MGAEIFKRYIVGLDYDKNQLTLSDPDGYRYEGRGQSLPIELKGDRPFLKAKALIPGAAPIEGSFVLDLGAQGAMSLQSSVVEKYHLLKANRKSIEHFVHGAAGEAREMLVRADSLHIGNFTINNPIVALSTAAKGSTADSSYVGVIGAGILSRYRITILYSQKQLILEPTPACNEPFEVDMSGGSLIATGPDFKVFVIERIVANSAMFEAGLRAGDIITSIDGKPSEAYPLDEIRDV